MRVTLDGESLSPETVAQAALAPPGETSLRLSRGAIAAMRRSRRVVEKAVGKGVAVYGITTGFGANADRFVPPEHSRLLQRMLVLSHSSGVGEPASVEVVRAAMLIRANSLAKGVSGVRPVVVERLIEMFREGVAPLVPSRGSVGASGDLAPLAHMALVLSRDPRPEASAAEDALARRARKAPLKGAARKKAVRMSSEALLWSGSEWKRMSGIEAMTAAGVERLVLEAKEGLALVNGTAFSAALLCHALRRARTAFDAALESFAACFEALLGSESSFLPALHRTRPHPGQRAVAERLSKLLAAPRRTSAAEPEATHGPLQDPYSLRCLPQILGPAFETLNSVEETLRVEINSATDNPLLLREPSGRPEAVSGGNFHAQPVAAAADSLRVALATVVNVAERLVHRLMDDSRNRGLPRFLSPDTTGLSSGLMLLQYGLAELAAECRHLAAPASVHTIPTCADQEDLVSMAPLSGRLALSAAANARLAAAVTALCGCQALWLRTKGKPKKLGPAARRLFRFFMKEIGPVVEDRSLSRDVDTFFAYLFPQASR